jgi:transcriptional regulator with XRE-family HTH domain
MAKTPRTRALATFDLNVSKRREELELSQVAAAGKCNLDPTYLSGIERGVRNSPVFGLAIGGLAK